MVGGLPTGSVRIVNIQNQSESVRRKRKMNKDPSMIYHITRSARNAEPVNSELPPHVLVSYVEGNESHACRIAVRRRDTCKDVFLEKRESVLSIMEEIRYISPLEKGEKTAIAENFLWQIGQRPQLNSWPQNLHQSHTFYNLNVLIRTVQTPVIQPGSARPFMARPFSASVVFGPGTAHPSWPYFLNIIKWQPSPSFKKLKFIRIKNLNWKASFKRIHSILIWNRFFIIYSI